MHVGCIPVQHSWSPESNRVSGITSSEYRLCQCESVRACTWNAFDHPPCLEVEFYCDQIPDHLSVKIRGELTDGKISHVDYVPEIAEEPDYDAALAAIKEQLS